MSSGPDPGRTLQPPRELAAFARSFAQRAARLAWLLGAGASAQSFIPTAGQLIDLLLRHVYCTERSIALDAVDLADPRTRQRLRVLYSGQQGLPEYDDPAFYSAIFELAYDQEQDRAAFLEGYVRDAKPNYGHFVLAALASAKLLKLILQTNFDSLPERAINPALDADLFSGLQLQVADLDNAPRAVAALAADRWPLLIKLHGDYRSARLKNTSEELRNQDEALRKAAAGALSRFGLVVAGYSGRDESVLAMLRDVLTLPTPFPAGLFWIRRPQDPLAPAVTDLLDQARHAGVDVAVVESTSFVDLMTHLEHAVELPQDARAWLTARAPGPLRRPEASPAGPTGTTPRLLLNAIPVLELPREARLLRWQKPVPVANLREALRSSGRRATVGIIGGHPVAFGPDGALAEALAPLGVQVTDECVQLQLDPGQADTQALGLVMEALIVGLARLPGLGHVFRQLDDHLLRVWNGNFRELRALRTAYGDTISGELRGQGNTRLPWAEAVALSLEAREEQWWLIVTPEIWVRPAPYFDPDTPPTTADLQLLTTRGKELMRSRWARRYNRQTGQILEAWRALLTGNTRRAVAAYEVPAAEGVDAVTVIDGSSPVSLLPLATRSTGDPTR